MKIRYKLDKLASESYFGDSVIPADCKPLRSDFLHITGASAGNKSDFNNSFYTGNRYRAWRLGVANTMLDGIKVLNISESAEDSAASKVRGE